MYFQNYPGYYDTADVGMKCKNGYITVSSRADDVINVAGHRISSSAIEEVIQFNFEIINRAIKSVQIVAKAILYHKEINECAVVELHDEIKGVVPFAFLVRNKSNLNQIEFSIYILIK